MTTAHLALEGGNTSARDAPSRREATALAGVLASVTGAVLVLVPGSHGLALAGALLLAAVPAGAAIMSWLDAGDDLAQVALVLVLSLAVFSLASALMIWLAVWAPDAQLVVAGVSVGSCATRLLWPSTEVRRADSGPARGGLPAQLALLALGVGAWAYGVGQLTRSSIGPYGLLPAVDGWFLAGLAALLAGFLLELRRTSPRGWLLGLYLIALICAIHSTVPIVFGTPEYAWVYKHIGIVQSLGLHGRVTDPSNIYQQWPLLFAAAAAVGALGHVAPLSWSTWAPLTFELAEALVLLGIFRLLVAERRVAYLAVLLYVGLISWVGQDYFSPQAFGYLLWLGIVLICVRWLGATERPGVPGTRLARLRAPLLVGRPAPPATSTRLRALAVALVAAVYFAIVAAHQLTPYLALAQITALALLDLIRPRWLPLLLAAIAVGYLAPRYSMIAHDFGGLFSGGNPIQNASGSRGSHHAGPEQLTAWIVRGLAACMWLGAIAVIVRERRTLGRVVLPAALAFSPFVLLFAQRYGGEAIYRVYLFSAPWCALLIAQRLSELSQPRMRLLLTGAVSLIAVFAGLQGLYGAVQVNGVTPAELTASQWLYGHIPKGSLVLLPVDDFPVLYTANYNDYRLQVMPADPQIGQSWLDESNLGAIETWLAELRYNDAYVPFTPAMVAYANFFGAPRAYATLAREVANAPGWSAVYRKADVTIYHLNLTRAAATAAPAAAAKTPATTTSARPSSRSRSARTKARGTTSKRNSRSGAASRSAPR